MDEAVLKETEEESAKGWADGPWELGSLEKGATISRRFPLLQGEKIRMIDDYSVSGVNDSCTINTKLDLHVIDTFVAAAKSYFEEMDACGKDVSLQAKAYDLKTAYRQIPIRNDHLNMDTSASSTVRKVLWRFIAQGHCLFGATHSVYNFLCLARMIHCISSRGAKLITTNFYDDFIFASNCVLRESAKNCMELIFLYTGWEFATEGKKTTSFF